MDFVVQTSHFNYELFIRDNILSVKLAVYLLVVTLLEVSEREDSVVAIHLTTEILKSHSAGGGAETINVPISTVGSGTPTTRPKTSFPVYGLGAGGVSGQGGGSRGRGTLRLGASTKLIAEGLITDPWMLVMG